MPVSLPAIWGLVMTESPGSAVNVTQALSSTAVFRVTVRADSFRETRCILTFTIRGSTSSVLPKDTFRVTFPDFRPESAFRVKAPVCTSNPVTLQPAVTAVMPVTFRDARVSFLFFGSSFMETPEESPGTAVIFTEEADSFRPGAFLVFFTVSVSAAGTLHSSVSTSR